MLARVDAVIGPSGVTSNELTPKDLLSLAGDAAKLGDIRHARDVASKGKEEQEELEDAAAASQAKDYQELHGQIDSSLTLLTSLEAFISTFQSDLSAVSGHISDLQGRSKVIEARLDNRKAVRNSLSPLLASITVSPVLIETLMSTEPSEGWLQPVAELEKILMAVKSGPRVAARKDLEDVVEKLRNRVTLALRGFLINLLTPYRTSVTPNLSIFQSSVLTKYRSFYAFLQRHAARSAHEVQKAYVSTSQWYYDTGFRRYVRALEKVRLRSITKEDPIGVVGSNDNTLSLLSRRNMSTVALGSPRASVDLGANSGNLETGAASPSVILAHMADNPDFKAAPEALFRSMSLVVADNARTEYAFISSFFGRPDDVSHPITSDNYNVTLMRQLGKGGGGGERSMAMANASIPEFSPSMLSSVQDDDSSSVLSDPAATGAAAAAPSRDRTERVKRHVADGIWKQVFEPSLEYGKNFIATMLSQNNPSALSLLSMIRQNDSVLEQLAGSATSAGGGGCPTTAMESYLIGLRLQLWPLFQKEMGANIDSVRKLAESGTASGGMAGVLGVRSAAVKDSVVAMIGKRYAHFFTSVVALSADQEDDMVFNSLLRLRNELLKLITTQSKRLNDAARVSGYLKNQYEQVVQALTSASTSHPRSQAEIAYWKELLRKA